jgi:hypothetical protein
MNSHRQFVYLKGKSKNTFPLTVQPIQGHWQGSYFIVEHIDHWTNTPMALPDNHSLPQWQYTRTIMKEMGITRHHQQTQMDKPKASHDIKQHQQQKPWSQHQWPLHQVKPKQVAITPSEKDLF